MDVCVCIRLFSSKDTHKFVSKQGDRAIDVRARFSKLLLGFILKLKGVALPKVRHRIIIVKVGLTKGADDGLHDGVGKDVDQGQGQGQVDLQVGRKKLLDHIRSVHEARGKLEQVEEGPSNVPDAEKVNENVDRIVVIGCVENKLLLQVGPT